MWWRWPISARRIREKNSSAPFTPLEIMIMAMHLLLQTGNPLGAVGVAEKAAPYVHSKLSSNVPAPLLPEDLEPDPPAEADEEGPLNPIW
jgi:hypothetical protein